MSTQRISIVALCLAIVLAVMPVSAARAADDKLIEVTTWALTMPDGEVVKVRAVQGQESTAMIRHKAFPHRLIFKAGAVDSATGLAAFELSKQGPERFSPVVNVIERQSVESLSKRQVFLAPDFEVDIEIVEARKIRASELQKMQQCKRPVKTQGQDQCCVTCGSTEACGCQVCMWCGECCVGWPACTCFPC